MSTGKNKNVTVLLVVGAIVFLYWYLGTIPGQVQIATKESRVATAAHALIEDVPTARNEAFVTPPPEESFGAD